MKIKQELKEVFLHMKPAKMLILLKDDEIDWYISKIAKESGATYVYTKQIFKILEREKLIKIIERGRTKKIMPTTKGLELANLLEELIKKCEINETNETSDIILPVK